VINKNIQQLRMTILNIGKLMRQLNLKQRKNDEKVKSRNILNAHELTRKSTIKHQKNQLLDGNCSRAHRGVAVECIAELMVQVSRTTKAVRSSALVQPSRTHCVTIVHGV